MRTFVAAAAVFGLSSLFASAAPLEARNPPLTDGFPNPSPAQVEQIQQEALGTLSNESVPANISKESITNLQLVALNELFEVEFFTSLLNNVTSGGKDWEMPQGTNKDFVVKTLQTIIAQEKLHLLNANGALTHFNQTPIQPCTDYIFPSTTFAEAIKLAGTFTSVVLGTIQDLIFHFADSGDAALTVGTAAVLGNEAEQEGWFRLLQGQIPNELPFLTTAVRDFAFTALQGFAAPGSCPSIKDIDLKTLLPLNVVDTPAAKTETIRFSFAAQGFKAGTELWVTYINQQNLPVVLPVSIVSQDSSTVTVSATFPYDQHMLNGLTIAALTDCEGPFETADDVIPAAIYGPGLIIVQAPGTDMPQHTTGYYVNAGSPY